ncbi:MAG TPA: hypothetical protein DDY18_01005 [Flavobacterium sp.]|nr:hypothetical protein [Flavobacterium sp.]
MSPEINFVGREPELKEIRKIIANPYGDVRIALILGEGGIGKTQLLKRILAEAKNFTRKILAPVEPLDLFSTELRNIDGIQKKIIETIEELTGLKGKESPFAEYYEENQDTSKQFNKCLRAFCANNKKPLLLAFDTFENLDTVASNWLFETGSEGLQVPGLICIVAGRPEKENLKQYISNPLVKEIKLHGLTLQEAQNLYQRISDETSQEDLLGDFLLAAGLPRSELQKNNEDFKWMWQITRGHPLKLEMAFRWVKFLGEKSLIGITAETFEERLMEKVAKLGTEGMLDVGNLPVSKSVFDTFVFMGYITRQFDERFLQLLVEKKFISIESNMDEENILENLEKYFFVKRRSGGDGKYVLQLHDEMARLVRENIWLYIDLSGGLKQRVLKTVIEFYSQLIKEEENESNRNVLRIEQLSYVLMKDLLEGKRLWFYLSDLDDEDLNSLLPGEIKEYKKRFTPQDEYEIRARIAQAEFEAGHLTQARREWQEIHELAVNLKSKKKDDWVANALFGLANCEKDVSKALRKYQDAKKFCEKKAPQYLPNVYYNIGFTYRRMQKIPKAIDWYLNAKEEFQKNPEDISLEAKILNDLGYAYSLSGDWEKCRTNVREGQKLRRELFPYYQLSEEEISEKIKVEKGMKKACFQLGLSYNTLGEVDRYDEALKSSIDNYTEALKMFRVTKNYHWQAKALFSRGETLRRIARTQFWNDKKAYDEHIKAADIDLTESLYLCEKHRVKSEQETANRRMGRVLHDRAIHEFEVGKNKPRAIKLLEQSQAYFERGLEYARETKDVLEELSNLTELAFIGDDFMAVKGLKTLPKEYRFWLDKLKKALDAHKKDKYRIYQYPVFSNLYKLEKAATEYQAKKYKESLKGFLEAFVGLASDPGYGRTRYKQHFPNLTDRIKKLPPKEAKIWCNAFIKKWTNTNDERGRLLSEEALPDLVVWCRQHLNKIPRKKD